jgi:hypothetical protein
MLTQHMDERDFIKQIARSQCHPILDMSNALEVDRTGAPDHANNLVPLFEQELRQVRSVLPGDAGNESTLTRHEQASYGTLTMR